MPQASSTRWCPTPEQLMILEEMYRSGVRTPNAPQIQQITAHLSYYGKIEGKNVFYWFQNHKARDRQKLRRRLGRHGLHQQHQMSHHAPPFHQTSELAPYSSSSSSSSWNQQRQILHQISPHSVQQEGTAAMNLISKLEASEGEDKLEKAMAAFPVSFASETTAVAAAVDAYATLPAACCRLPRTLELFPTRSTAGFFGEEGGSSKPADSRFTSP